MAKVVLIMYRKAIAQGVMARLQDKEDINLVYEPDYSNAKNSLHNHNAKAALIEVTESGPYDMDYCLALCKELRMQVPGCKLLLMCPEQDEKSIRKVVDAKCDNLIDDFVFYDVTIDYLASKLISI
jgi:DNA-binding NarL/FixJ family response regulator